VLCGPKSCRLLLLLTPPCYVVLWLKDVSFHAMPADKQTATTTAAAEPQAAAMQVIDQQSQAATGSIQSLLELFSSLPGDATALPPPPVLASSSEGQQQEQQQLGRSTPAACGSSDCTSFWSQHSNSNSSSRQAPCQNRACSSSRQSLRSPWTQSATCRLWWTATRQQQQQQQQQQSAAVSSLWAMFCTAVQGWVLLVVAGARTPS